MVSQFIRWLEQPDNAASAYDTRGIDRFLKEHAYAPRYRNRLGTELLRFAKYALDKPGLSFIRAVMSLDKGQTMPKEDRQKLTAAVNAMLKAWKQPRRSKSPGPDSPLDVSLAFMDKFGARPNEGLKLIEGGGKLTYISKSSTLEPTEAAGMLEATGGPAWRFELTASETKTKAPYVWFIPAQDPQYPELE
jgi:hypothetical protein